jgi:glutathione S-transferase
MLTKTASLAALAATAALALPVAGLADDGTPNPPQSAGTRLARIQERIARVETRLATAQERLAKREQMLADRCSTPQPATTGTDGQSAAAPSHADRCARAQARLERVKDRLQKVQARLDKVKDRVQKWLENHGGQTGSSLSSGDQQALDGLQQQLEGPQS